MGRRGHFYSCMGLMRHIGFRRMTVVNGTPENLGRHIMVSEPRFINT